MIKRTGELLEATLARPPGEALSGVAPKACPYWCAQRGSGAHGPFHRLVLEEARLTEFDHGDRTTVSYGVRRRAVRTDQQSWQLRADLAVASSLARRSSRPVLPVSRVLPGH